MNCNLSSYLREQEMTCLRIAKAANENTPEQREWLQTAQVLMDRSADHIQKCDKCKNGKNG